MCPRSWVGDAESGVKDPLRGVRAGRGPRAGGTRSSASTCAMCAEKSPIMGYYSESELVNMPRREARRESSYTQAEPERTSFCVSRWASQQVSARYRRLAGCTSDDVRISAAYLWGRVT